MTELIGREKELEQITSFLSYHSRNPKLVTLHGPGGIGKTAILRALNDKYRSQPGFVTTDLIDLVEERLSQVRYLRSRIALQLDPEQKIFEEYYHAVSELDFLLGRKADAQLIVGLRHKIERAFTFSYERVIKEQDVSIIVFLDTLEIIEAYRSEWESQIVPFLGMLPSTYFILAGRDGHRWRPFFTSQFLMFNELSLPILGLSLDETQLFFGQSGAGRDTVNELQEKTHLLTRGRPILIDLAIEWLRRSLPFSDLSLVNIATLQAAIEKAGKTKSEEIHLTLEDGSTITLDALTKKFERELIENILELPARHKLPILSMVYLQQIGMTPSLLKQIVRHYLTNLDDENALFNELKEFTFIKPLPGNRLILHDEASRMIGEHHLWDRFDSSREVRLELFALLRKYFEKEAEQQEASFENEASISYAKKEALNQEIDRLRCQQLHFAFEVDVDAGYKEFHDLFEKSTRLRLFLLSEGLLDVAMSYATTKQQTFQVQLERISYCFNSALYDVAEEIIRDMLSDPDVPPAIQVDLYFHLGNVVINLGRGVAEARRHYQVSLAICTDKNLAGPKPKILNELGYLHRLQGNLQDAVKYYELAYEMAIQNGDKTEEISALINWSFVDSRLGEYDHGREKLEKVYNDLQAQKPPDRESAGRYYSVLGEVFRYQGNLELAIEAYNNALSQFTSPDDEAWPGLILSQRGAAYLNQFIEKQERIDLANRAKEDLAIAVEMCRRANKNVLPMALHRYGRYFQAVQDYQSAIKVFREGYQISKLQEDWQFVVENLTNLSEVLFYQWERIQDSASVKDLEDNFGEIEKIRKDGFSYPHLYGKMQQLLADVLILQERYGDALELYVQSIRNMAIQERFVGRDRLDKRLMEIEPLIAKMPSEWQDTWWIELYMAAKESDFSEQPEVMAYLTERYTLAKRG